MRELVPPIVQAPMAGGASNPVLAATVSNAGGLGFLAAGYLTAAQVRAQIGAVRAATPAPFGVNIFVPTAPRTGDLASYRGELAAEARRYGVSLGEPPSFDDDEWEAKLAVVADEAVPVVSFAFGCPPAEVVERLHAAGSFVIVTVTSTAEALLAVRAGADAVCAQGREAGAHRSSFSPLPGPETDVGLLALLEHVVDAVPVPVIATGGIMTGRSVAAVLAAGAVAAQLGTAFLRTPESGAHPLHKAALADPRFTSTSVTLAFTGRSARGLTNRFMREHGDGAPVAYPAVHHLTRPIRQAAAAAGDTSAMALWAGQGYRLARELPAAHVVDDLYRDLEQALSIVVERRLR